MAKTEQAADPRAAARRDEQDRQAAVRRAMDAAHGAGKSAA